ncbi:MFS transporter [Streptomyces sp. NPDC054933]
MVAPIVGRLAGRYGPYPVMAVGYLVSAVALAGLCLLGVGSGMVPLAFFEVALGLGMGVAISPTQAAGVAALPRERSGLAAACISTTRQSGTAVGVAVLVLIVAAYSGGSPGTAAYRQGFTHGLHIAGLVAAAPTLVAALAAAGFAWRAASRGIGVKAASRTGRRP